MSLFHSRPVVVQRVYYKPSVMARLKAILSPNHHRRRPVVTAAPRRTGRKRVVIRQPVRKTGFFHRTPHRTVVATQRKPGFFASLRPRQTRSTHPAHPHHGHYRRGKHHHSGHKGSTMAALLAAFALKKKHNHGHHHDRRRHF